MPRSHPLAAAALTSLALAVAWLGTAHALASTDPTRIDSIDETFYLAVAMTATFLAVGACGCSLPWGILASVGVTAGLWWGAGEAKAIMDVYSGGWMGGFNDLVYLVPIASAVVSVISVLTCVATGRCPSPSRRQPPPEPEPR